MKKDRQREEAENDETLSLRKLNENLQIQLKRERGGRKRLVSRIATLVCAAANATHSNTSREGFNTADVNIRALPQMQNSKVVSVGPDALSILDISDTSVSDEDLVTIRNIILQCRPVAVHTIRLSSNFISDAGAREIALMLAQPNVFRSLKNIDLRSNSISNTGITLLKQSLQRNKDFALEEVVLNHDGLLEGMVRDLDYNPTISNGTQVSTCKIPGFKVVLSIDVRDNVTPSKSSFTAAEIDHFTAALLETINLSLPAIQQQSIESKSTKQVLPKQTGGNKKFLMKVSPKKRSIEDKELRQVYGETSSVTKSSKKLSGSSVERAQSTDVVQCHPDMSVEK